MLEPLGTRVVGELVVVDGMRSQGLVFLPFAKKMPYQMRVLAVGPKCKFVKVGSIVILPNDSRGASIKVTDDETGETFIYFAVEEDDCLAQWVEENASAAAA